MTKLVFLVLILGFGPHVLITSNNGNSEIRQLHLVLIGQGFPKIDYQPSYGIIPRTANLLLINQEDKNEAPIFAGATNPVDEIDNIAWRRQKEKLAGLAIRRIMACPVVSEDKYPHNSLA